jgi:hypothetical protein
MIFKPLLVFIEARQPAEGRRLAPDQFEFGPATVRLEPEPAKLAAAAASSDSSRNFRREMFDMAEASLP